MKIALVHSFYRSDSPSGENSVVLQQAKALSQSGFDVQLFARHSDNLEGHRWLQVQAAKTVATGFGFSPLSQIQAFGPAVVHVHNLFPNFGKEWLKYCRYPIVTTLHNFRGVCANGLLLRDGNYCESCVSRNSLTAIRYACYRQSRVATIPLALATRKGIHGDTQIAQSDAVIVLSEPARRKFIEFGVAPEAIHVIPNGVFAAGAPSDPGGGADWLYVGRMSAEKGINELLDEWPDSHQLSLVGDGPLGEVVKNRVKDKPNITFVGPIDRNSVLSVMAGSQGLVFPSICFEMQPTVLSEATAVGLPILCRTSNSWASMVAEHSAGVTYSDRHSLLQGIRAVEARRDFFSFQALKWFEADFAPSTWLQSIGNLYHRLAART